MDRKPRTTFQLDSPFTTSQWPQITPQNQEIILEVLCSLLSQIGQYQSNYITHSKGKRSKKRKRQEAKAEGAPTAAIPPAPELSNFLTVGLNGITRTLQFSSQNSRPKTNVLEVGNTAVPDDNELRSTLKLPRDDGQSLLQGHFSVIFISQSSRSTVLHEYLPQLIVTASLAYPDLPATRLVEIPIGGEARVREALGIPRVSSIGILDGATRSGALVSLVRDIVPEIEILWLQQAKKMIYLPVKINAIQTFSTYVKKSKA